MTGATDGDQHCTAAAVCAVEQLGLDKAVPSRILELMGNEYSLTRHNIASHLQVPLISFHLSFQFAQCD